MKRTLVASLILILCLIIGAGSLVYIEVSCNDMIKITDTAIDSILTRNAPKLTESLQNSVDRLEKSRPVLNLIIGQDDTIELRGNLNKAIFYCNCNDYSTAILHLQEYKSSLNRIISSNEPTPSTIF